MKKELDDRVRVSARIHRKEDPGLHAFLAEVDGDDRSARARMLLREGYRAHLATARPIMPQDVGAVAGLAPSSPSQTRELLMSIPDFDITFFQLADEN